MAAHTALRRLRVFSHRSYAPSATCINRHMTTISSPAGTPFATPSSMIARKRLPIISVAPMVDVTDVHYRYMARMLTKRTTLYTPMVSDLALLKDQHGVLKHLRRVRAEDQPTVAQLGGSDPVTMAAAAKLCEQQGYAAVNINLGCPADSAVDACYGASLMFSDHTPAMIHAVRLAVQIPVTVKMRIAVFKTKTQSNAMTDEERYSKLHAFVTQIAATPSTDNPLQPNNDGIQHVILHCRDAILSFNPRDNRQIPPLKYEFAYNLKRDFPHLTIELNGGVTTIDSIKQHLAAGLDGVMLGRAAWKDIWMLTQVDEQVYGDSPFTLTRPEIIERYIPIANSELQEQLRLVRTIPGWKPYVKNILEPLIHMYSGTFAGKKYRSVMVEGMRSFCRFYINQYGREEDIQIKDLVATALREVTHPDLRTPLDAPRSELQAAEHAEAVNSTLKQAMIEQPDQTLPSAQRDVVENLQKEFAAVSVQA